MRHCFKGFTLVEMLVTIAVLAILASIALPSFTTMMRSTRADSEINDLFRGLNYARLEAINRGMNVRLSPATAGAWTGILNINAVSGGAVVAGAALRVLPGMSSTAALSANNVAYIEFNNLGGLANPASSLTLSYTQVTLTRTIGVCLNGRIILGATCP